ncbi:MAG: hypothetical protein WC975_02270 [Phycisphaerae bacterium]
MDKNSLFSVAEQTAQWMIANQVFNRLDANKGRTINCYESVSGHLDLTTSWQTGGVCMGLLAMYKRTGEKAYLDRAELAGRYIMSLQVMDPRQECYYGTIRECTPQSLEFCPRDATTAAWAFIWLYEATQNSEYLDRAILFGNWHMKHGMYKGWPLWAVFMDGEFTDYYARGSFQSGTGLFYHDLFMATGDTRYIEFGLEPIARIYRDEFFLEDGSIIPQRDVFTNKITKLKPQTVETDIHGFNDDFGTAMLQAAADLFGDESYRQTARKFAHWLADHQESDGGFRNKKAEVHSAVPMAMMYFDELGTFFRDEKLLAARDKALTKLLSMQVSGTGDVKLDGGFRGMFDTLKSREEDMCVHMRTSMYALIALLKLEGKVSGVWLGNKNRRFIDPLDQSEEIPYQFKW